MLRPLLRPAYWLNTFRVIIFFDSGLLTNKKNTKFLYKIFRYPSLSRFLTEQAILKSVFSIFYQIKIFKLQDPEIFYTDPPESGSATLDIVVKKYMTVCRLSCSISRGGCGRTGRPARWESTYCTYHHHIIKLMTTYLCQELCW